MDNLLARAVPTSRKKVKWLKTKILHQAWLRDSAGVRRNLQYLKKMAMQNAIVKVRRSAGFHFNSDL
jgi:dGTP triphosphohydrolase